MNMKRGLRAFYVVSFCLLFCGILLFLFQAPAKAVPVCPVDICPTVGCSSGYATCATYSCDIEGQTINMTCFTMW